jgi:DNA-binding CsgD family transcriptional regulator
MSTIFARFLGLSQGQQLTYDAAVLLIERRSPLSRSESYVIVLDYLGFTRDEICGRLKISTETIRTYWKRIYRKTNCRGRRAIRRWLESTLQKELEGAEAA